MLTDLPWRVGGVGAEQAGRHRAGRVHAHPGLLAHPERATMHVSQSADTHATSPRGRRTRTPMMTRACLWCCMQPAARRVGVLSGLRGLLPEQAHGPQGDVADLHGQRGHQGQLRRPAARAERQLLPDVHPHPLQQGRTREGNKVGGGRELGPHTHRPASLLRAHRVVLRLTPSECLRVCVCVCGRRTR